MNQNSLKLYSIGISHKTATVAEREIFQIGRKEIPSALKTIFSYDGVEGVLIVTTCNRLEFYLVLQPGILPFDIIKNYYKDINEKDAGLIDKIFSTYENSEATSHLFRVISGLESLVLGEYQVQGQVREAYSIACEAKTVEKILHKLLHAAFRTGKRVRSSTSLGEGKQSVSGVAAQIMIANLKPDASIAIIGVNENTKILAEELTGAGFRNFIFINRTLYKAQMMAEQYGGAALPLQDIEKGLSAAEAVFSSTGAPGFIVSSDMLVRLIAENHCPRLIIDMAVPRDIDTGNLPESFHSYDIGDLQFYLEKQEQAKLAAIPDAEKIIDDEVKIFQAWSETQGNEIMEPYSEKFEQIRQQLLEESRDQFSEQAFERVEKLTHHLLHRMQSTFTRALIKQIQEVKAFKFYKDAQS